jgi:arylsulfatase A-like enzyme
MRLLFAVVVLAIVPTAGIVQSAERSPNFVIVFLDDSGWADFQPFGNPNYSTPNVDQLAKEGCRFDNFYVPQAVCSASRAALMTGCYPGRTKVFGAHAPRNKCLDPKYATMAEQLRKAGYATACFGKWHLGDVEGQRPLDRGFDENCGLMYSNDMWRHHPDNPEFWGKFPLQYWDHGQVTIEDVTAAQQKNLTTWYTEHAVDFISRHKEKPFLLYVPHSMPHVPIFCSDKFEGKSGAGLYGDVIMELDWSVGQIAAALKRNGIEEDTIFVLTSDNGPWVSYGNHAGSTPFREAKGTSFDGGVRSACVIKWPRRITAGSRSTKTFCSIDLLPTFLNLAKADLPDNPVDGLDVYDILVNKPDAANPHEYYPFSTGKTFEGIITADGKWKLHLPHKYRSLLAAGKDGDSGKYASEEIPLSLFNMQSDPLEQDNVIDDYPDVAARLVRLAEQHKKRFWAVDSQP